MNSVSCMVQKYASRTPTAVLFPPFCFAAGIFFQYTIMLFDLCVKALRLKLWSTPKDHRCTYTRLGKIQLQTILSGYISATREAHSDLEVWF